MTSCPDPCGGECATPTGCAQCGCGQCAGGPAADAAVSPGLAAVPFGHSGYAVALDRMRQRLAAADLPGLRGLTDRHAEPPLDPALALLDGWACAGAVLGFYTERLVQEHYLRTCRERRSAVELGRLVGYAPRPGVAADVHLAFTLDDRDPEAELRVPVGTRAYSQPGPGETMQPFETDEDLGGRPRWNVLRPRQTAPQRLAPNTRMLEVAGTTTGLAPGGRLVTTIEGKDTVRTLQTIAAIEVQPKRDRTRVTLAAPAAPAAPAVRPRPATVDPGLLNGLLDAPAAFTAGRDRLPVDPARTFADDSYAVYGLLEQAYPNLRGLLDRALGGTAATRPTGTATVHALRVRAGLHGQTVPPYPDFDTETGLVRKYREWNFAGTGLVAIPQESEAVDLLGDAVQALGSSDIALDGVYDAILPGSLVAIVPPALDGDTTGIREVKEVRTETRPAFNLPARVTVLTLTTAWRNEKPPTEIDRKTVVYAVSELLDLPDAPIDGEVCAGELVLDGYYPGLTAGRRVIVAGERTDLKDRDGVVVTGVPGVELLMTASVAHRADADADGNLVTTDGLHTVLTFAAPDLQYCYRRSTVRLHGNVAHATHGETRAEVLGSGDATRPALVFPLKQGPLTFVPDTSPAGIRSTLRVRVDDLRWHEAPNAAAAAPRDRAYLLRLDDGGATTVLFGLGARPSTGVGNIRATYRSGLGRAGNVRDGQVSVLATRPHGVSEVTNPAPAAGGADPDDLDAVRRRVPIGLTALDRLVSAADVEDFARAFAGIGKARISGGPTEYVLTVAAVDDAPLTKESALLTNLRRALARFGDLDLIAPDGLLQPRGAPTATVEVRIRAALLLVLRARVRLAPDHEWEVVVERLRAALDAAFGFAAREIGQQTSAGEAMAVLAAVPGVAWVDLVAFGAVSLGAPGQPASPAEVAQRALEALAAAPAGLPPDPQVDPTGLAYLALDAQGTVLLEPDPEEDLP